MKPEGLRRAAQGRSCVALWGALSLCVAIAMCAACQRAPEGTAPTALAAPTPESTDAPGAGAALRTVFDVTRGLDGCSFGHKGALLDFGDPSMTAGVHPGMFHADSDEIVEREGATWLRARARAVVASFYWPGAEGEAPESTPFIEARIHGLSARSVAISVDAKPFGSIPLAKGQTRVVFARGLAYGPLVPGGHELALHFAGGGRGGGEALADIDWVHVGSGEAEEQYAAPSRAEVLQDVAVGGKSLRSLSLRAPGFARCTRWIPADATLETSLATAGGGDADVEARILRDRHPPVVLGTAHVSGGQDWAAWSLPVTGLEGDGALAALELLVVRAAKGTRALFGSPRIVATRTVVAAVAPPARGALLVVLGSTAAKALSPWGGPHAVPELARLASSGVAFTANRAPTSLPSVALASMLTGLPPFVSPSRDEGRLSETVTTVQQACREGGVSTAMFTADPTTGAAFGFDRGWDTFVAHDPLEDVPGTRVFEDAAAWIEAHRGKRFLVVVHARGGHPPWDVTPDELKAMPPSGYLGMIDPRRAAEALAKARRHPARFKDDDRVRAMALYEHAIEENDRSLGHLLSALESTDRDADTVVVVTSDVAASEATPVPFDDTDTLEEPVLATPLVVRWPSSSLVGHRIATATESTDLARTLLGALGMTPPAGFGGRDLQQVAQGAVLPSERPLLATRAARFSLRWGSFVLLGVRERETRMCDLAQDPACIADVRASSPLSLEAMRREALAGLARPPSSVPALAPAPIDEHTAAALVRWGRGVGRED